MEDNVCRDSICGTANMRYLCTGVVGVRCNAAPCLASCRLTWLTYLQRTSMNMDIIDTSCGMCISTTSAALFTHRLSMVTQRSLRVETDSHRLIILRTTQVCDSRPAVSAHRSHWDTFPLALSPSVLVSVCLPDNASCIRWLARDIGYS